MPNPLSKHSQPNRCERINTNPPIVSHTLLQHRTKNSACLTLGSLGRFCISPSIVFQLLHILKEIAVNWKYEFLYVPFFIPFTVVSIVTIAFYWRSYDKGVGLHQPFKEAGQRVAGTQW